MTGTTRSSEGLDPRRRKILFRSWHRGIREVDLLTGRFADRYISELSDSDLDDFEKLLMDVPDHDLYYWITEESTAPAVYDTAVLRSLRDFHQKFGGGR